MPGIRIDAGVVEGSDISVHYDPLLAKLIAVGESREAARRRALAALDEFPILGVTTNAPYLRELLQHPSFVSGDLHTGFLATEHERLTATLAEASPAVVDAIAAQLAGAAPGVRLAPPLSVDPWDRLTR
jgi:acetyl/propionyl-CoA carboxylase alpha subunit